MFFVLVAAVAGTCVGASWTLYAGPAWMMAAALVGALFSALYAYLIIAFVDDGYDGK
ncbi:hypothetical protein SAMN02799631_05911 [Methylobacterium sp. 174MFSha1.1]|nr:hypothetical protein SAMN02799631_05911 [Methylobacterium sp. 174MFSha1.1]